MGQHLELDTTIVVMLPLIMFCQLIGTWLQSKHPHLMRYLPEVGVIILAGIVVGVFIKLLQAAGIDKTDMKGLSTFSPALFFVGLLPPIIFNGGFHLKRLLFFINFVPIMTFAIGGTLLSAAIIAGGLKTAISSGLVGGDTAGPHHALYGVTWAECWAFGALISATDPVSTLVLFAELRVEPHLFYLVFGESVLNDAVGLVLFDTASDFIKDPSLGSSALIGAAGSFLIILVGSLLVGIVLSICMAAIIKRSELHNNLVLEQGLVILFVYLPYVIGELCSLSGIVTTLTAGMASRKFIYPTLNPVSQDMVVGVLRLMSDFAETAAFLNLGLTCVLANLDYYNPLLIFWSIALCSVSRPLQVYLFSAVLNRCCSIPRPIDRKTQHMLSFAGLRGVVAFACVTLWPQPDDSDDDRDGASADDRRKLFLATTSCVILFTVFVQGGLTVKMLEWLSIEVGTDENTLTVTEAQPGFIKVAINVVNTWIAPLALSQNQMDELAAARQMSRAAHTSVSTSNAYRSGNTHQGQGGNGHSNRGDSHSEQPGYPSSSSSSSSRLHSFPTSGVPVTNDDNAAKHKDGGGALPPLVSIDTHTKEIPADSSYMSNNHAHRSPSSSPLSPLSTRNRSRGASSIFDTGRSTSTTLGTANIPARLRHNTYSSSAAVPVLRQSLSDPETWAQVNNLEAPLLAPPGSSSNIHLGNLRETESENRESTDGDLDRSMISRRSSPPAADV